MAIHRQCHRKKYKNKVKEVREKYKSYLISKGKEISKEYGEEEDKERTYGIFECFGVCHYHG
ncbi:MAG: hypothetical protein NY202_00550 [Mollicutes bacterium UO1]